MLSLGIAGARKRLVMFYLLSLPSYFQEVELYGGCGSLIQTELTGYFKR